MRISGASLVELKSVQAEVTSAIKELSSFEESAQVFTSKIYERFKESIVLARMFLSIRYSQLPSDVRSFVDTLAGSTGITDKINPDTLVLTLMGTSGAKADWNDRRKSAGHVGIPLASADFIEAIPMMSRLLKQLGMGLDWIDSSDTDLVVRTTGSMGGVFFVPDAATETDNKGRNIIAATDFVKANNVQSVFGYGGGYLGTDAFSVTIIFLRTELERQTAERFASMMAFFKADTVGLVKNKQYFR